MTHNQVGTLVGDLVAMAKAYEELPGVREELAKAQALANSLQDMVASREERIMALKAEEDSLNARIRGLEVERDNAELRFLELDERAAKAVRFLAQVEGMAKQAELELSPPKPEPEPTPAPNYEHGKPYVYDATSQTFDPSAQGQSEVPPQPAASVGGTGAETTASGTQTDVGTAPAPQSAPQPPSSWAQPEGERASDPTQSQTTTDVPSMESQSQTVPATSASTNVNSVPTSTESAQPGPFTGRLYFQVPRYVSLSDWLAGGGTEADYHFRP